MKLSIIVVNYNTSSITVNCLKSIYKFAPKFSFEVIVVDNASTDDSITALKKFNEITLIQNKENLGFSKANNRGIKTSKGEFILLLNSDTLIINNVLGELVDFAENHNDAGIVAPKLLNKNKTMQPSIYNLPTIRRAINQYWLHRSNALDKYGITTHEPEEVESVVGAAFLITPKARKRVGYLNEKYFMYFEDLDYCRSVRKAGLKVYYLPCSYLIHLHGASGGPSTNSLNIESSKKYFGTMQYYAYTFILWSSQKLKRMLS